MEFHKPGINRILFTTDFSENADRAFGYAASLADAHNAAVTVLHVLEEIPPKAELMIRLFEGYESSEALQEKSEAEIFQRVKTYIERYCASFNERFPACRFMVKAVEVDKGDPVKRILRHSCGGYDVLVMGGKEHGLVQDIWMGGVLRGVLRQCSIPVFIVPPERLFSWIFTIFLVVAIVIGLAMALRKAKQQTAAAPVWTPRPAPVETATVAEGELGRTFRYLARLEAAASAEIAPRLSARIVALEANEGDIVAKGDLPARLDDRDIRARIDAAQADVTAAESRLASARAGAEAARSHLTYARQEYDRDPDGWRL